MWSSRRSFLFLALAGCGFSPAYGVKSPARALFGQVALAKPKTRNDFDFVADVEATLGPAASPAFDLAYTITTTPVGVGITTTGETTRYTLTGKLDYTLTARKDGQRVTGGSLQTFTAWSATGSAVAGITAEADANRRLMQALADEMISRLTMDMP